jgi:hypothetical protein
MTSTLLALAAATALLQPTPGLEASLIRTQAASNLLARCPDPAAGEESMFVKAPAAALLSDLRGVYGRGFARSDGVAAEPAPCPPAGQAERALRAATGEAQRLAALDAARFSKGLWVGPVHACGAAVAGAKAVKDAWGDAAAEIRLTAEAAATLGRFSAEMVEEHMVVRLDGRVVSRPQVQEPVSDAVDIHGPTYAEVERIVRAALRPSCD